MPDGGLRVATLLGSDGHCEHLTLPGDLLDKVAFAESLVSARDRIFNAEMPVFERTAHLWTEEQRGLWKMRRNWRSWKRLARASSDLERDHAQYDAREIWVRWKDYRFASPKLDLFCDLPEFSVWAEREGLRGDQILLAHLNIWRRKVSHLHDMSASVRSKAARRRQDNQRVWAHRVSRRYRDIVVEDIKIREMAATATVEPLGNRTMRANLRLASPALLLLCLRHAAPGRVHAVRAAWTTITCTACGQVGEPTPDLTYVCPHCSEALDQDIAAAANLLGTRGALPVLPASGSVVGSPPTPLAIPGSRKSPVEGASSRRTRRRARAVDAAE
jgi:hypothetical protein